MNIIQTVENALEAVDRDDALALEQANKQIINEVNTINIRLKEKLNQVRVSQKKVDHEDQLKQYLKNIMKQLNVE